MLILVSNITCVKMHDGGGLPFWKQLSETVAHFVRILYKQDVIRWYLILALHHAQVDVTVIFHSPWGTCLFSVCQPLVELHSNSVVDQVRAVCGLFEMCSCSLCSKNLYSWFSFRHHFKSLHGIDMQQCTQCSEPVPRGVLMVQHMTMKHLVRCSVELLRSNDKGNKVAKKKWVKRKMSHTDKKSSPTMSPTCSVALSRLWTEPLCKKCSLNQNSIRWCISHDSPYCRF